MDSAVSLDQMGRALLWGASGAIALATTLGFLARVGWLCELACHFRLQYAAAAAAVSLVAALTGEPGLALISAAVSAANLIAMRPSSSPASARGAGRPLRLLLSNVLFTNSDRQRLLALINREQPDLVIVIEVTDEWLEALSTLEARYPFSRSAMHLGGFGLALYSRLPLRSVEVVHVGRAGLPSILTHVVADGRQWTVIATHPFSPKSPSRAQLRDNQLVELAQLVRRQPGPLAVVGDLNTTPWSPIFRDFLRLSGLRDSRQGFGLQASWPTEIPFMRIPLDHCLVSGDVAVMRRSLAPSVGSDHLPVIVECALRA